MADVLQHYSSCIGTADVCTAQNLLHLQAIHGTEQVDNIYGFKHEHSSYPPCAICIHVFQHACMLSRWHHQTAKLQIAVCCTVVGIILGQLQ